MIFSGKEEAHFWSACSSELFEPYPPQLLIYPHTNDWARSSVRSKAHQLPTTYVLVYLKTNTPSQGCQILQIRIHHLEHEQALKCQATLQLNFCSFHPSFKSMSATADVPRARFHPHFQLHPRWKSAEFETAGGMRNLVEGHRSSLHKCY